MGYYQYFRVKNTPFFGQFFEWAKIRGFGLWVVYIQDYILV